MAPLSNRHSRFHQSTPFARLTSLLVALALVGGCAPVAETPSEKAAVAERRTDGEVPGDHNAVEETVPSAASPKPVEIPAALKERVALAIEHVRRRDLLVTNAFWTIFHGILAFGSGQTLYNPQTGTRVNAIDYIFSGRTDQGEIRGLAFIPTKYGLDVQMGPTYVGQGHQDQLIGYLVQCGLKKDQKIVVFGKDYTVMDIVAHTKMRVRVGQELSWSIIMLAEYLGTEAKWTNMHGEAISVPDLVRSEVQANVENAACGGTHRLEGLTWVLHTHLRRGGKKEGLWKEVENHLVKYQKLSREWQNPDGTFSTGYYKSAGNDPDVQRRIGTTGHILEFLSMSLPDEELKAQWVQDAAGRLALLFLENQSLPIESGALYHSVHGLVLYYARVFPWDLDKPAEKRLSSRASRP